MSTTARRGLVVWAAFAALFLFAFPARAHKPSDSYLTLEASGADLEGRWDIALRDLEYALHIDTDGSGTLTWGELRSHRAEVEAYAFARLSITRGGAACPSAPGSLEVVEHSDGTYAVLRFRATCVRAEDAARRGENLEIAYALLFDIDPQHHGLLHLVGSGGGRTAVFTAAARTQRFDLGAGEETHSFVAAVRDGMGHIWQGIDHLLFLLALLLPSVLRREAGVWRPVPRFGTAFRDVLGIVTAFTIAHSITLSLAALDVVRLPSRIVESGIAASVILAALNNLYPVLRGERWSAAFALGLLHGFGFSAVLVDLGLPKDQLLHVLFGFNVGVEIGQFAVVAVFLPLAYFARKRPIYRQIGLVGGSAVIAVVATIWFVERAFAVRLIS